MKIRLLPLPFYMGLSLLCIGSLFRFQHWEGGAVFLFCGTSQQTIFMLLTLLEIFTSKKARLPTKLMWGCFYASIPPLAYFFFPVLFLLLFNFIAGNVYLGFGRKKFIAPRSKVRKVQFDSIEA